MVCKHGFDIDMQFTAYTGIFPKELESFGRCSKYQTSTGAVKPEKNIQIPLNPAVWLR